MFLRVYLIVAMEQTSVRMRQAALLYQPLVLPMIIPMPIRLPVQQYVVKMSMCRVMSVSIAQTEQQTPPVIQFQEVTPLVLPLLLQYAW